MLRVGIDEAGYGPKLGPLVISATWIRGAFVPGPCPVPVGDSKKLFTQSKGVGLLERSVLAFASQLVPLRGLTWRKFRKKVAGSAPDLPWDGDFRLPWKALEVPHGEVNHWIKRFGFGAAARMIEPEGINRTHNKADLLFAEEVELIKGILSKHPEEPAVFRIGKHGGRRFYHPRLSEAFDTLLAIETEKRGTSIYSGMLDGRPVRFEFLRDGEDRDFYLALGSMFAKYLREGAMRLFNEYWQKEVEGLKPTAGYGTDGTRFYRDIEPALTRLQMAPSRVLRGR